MLTPVQQVRLKRAAQAYARAHHVPIPPGFAATFLGVGRPARELIRRVQLHAGLPTTGLFDEVTRALLIPPPGPAYGVDVSNHQPSVDWKAVRASGAKFAILKASEGHTFADPYYAGHRAGAKAQGLVVGAYHFARPSSSSGATQALYFLARATPTGGDIIPALDLEVSDGISAAQLRAWIADFSTVVKARTQHNPIIYTYPSFWRDHVGTADFANEPLWIANYGVTHPDVPGGWSTYAIWQFTSNGYVRGVPGRVDRNVAPKGLAGLTL